ncbi:type IV toxin-antitoxin system AbiEi family antitoxin [Cupriavidus sp. AcVe19-6a]|uniref:type IV toxin-antitoxin system AbiEi family antitoxin domain-containing protein n=1 Tax=Cupriavidus sp. AcVe19-6a TaxID=2821358 RepID=UPI001AE12563|nr:type IV toxin-antitoxin system AbiEi family antitoxin [Cupriavidus sp. AcVe19-6a]MBP0639613.1 hypothetical protein [Cupriavidus sp. AcVe19-6a]
MLQRNETPSQLPELPGQRQVGAAARYVDQLAARGRVTFSIAKLCTETGLSQRAARDQLRRLANKVARVSPRKDFFVIVRPEQRAMGAPPASWWLDAFFKMEQRPYYIALLSAAAEFGSHHQAVQEVQVITDRPMRDLVLGRQRIRFFVKHDVATTPTITPEKAFAPVAVSSPAATALDLLRYADRIGGISRAIEVIRGMSHQIRKPDLKRAVLAESETANLQRMGYLLAQLELHSEAKLVQEALPGRLQWVWFDRHEGRSAANPDQHLPIEANFRVLSYSNPVNNNE